MKFLIVAFFLIALHSVPEQTDKPNASKNDAQPTPPATTVNQAPIAGPGAPTKENGANSEANQSNWCERLTKPLVDNWPVLIVTIVGIAVAISTVKAIKEQAVLMDKQLKEMQTSGVQAGKQTEHLINAERAWIQVPEIILRQKLSFVTPPPTTFFIWLWPYIVNNGRTHARIVRIIARTEILEKAEGSDSPSPPKLPEQPQFRPMDTLLERNIILSPKQGINWTPVHIAKDDLESLKKRESFLYIYGRIDYVDISETERHTGFCRIYWIPGGDSDPSPIEDFIDSAVIPAAYT